MVYVLFTLLIASFVALASCDEGNSTHENNTFLFMDKLKNVLRRNNDDYIDLSKTKLPETVSTTLANTHKTTTSKTRDVVTTTNKQRLTTNNRRAMDPINTVHKVKPKITKTTQNNNVNQQNKSTLKPNKLLNEKNEFKDKYPKYVNKISKMKTFFNKNKDLFKKFMENRSSKLIPLLRFKNTTLTTKKAIAIGRNKYISAKGMNTGTKRPETGIKDTGTKGRAGKAGRALFTSTSSESSISDTLEYMDMEPGKDRIANSQQLDMAPAQGGYIHAQRLKGRLCQRNVLIPEGPKYDSKGKAYLAAYTAVRGHDFSQTKAPKAYLPRCCNCCKKSVLGCE